MRFLFLAILCAFVVSCSTKVPDAQLTFHTQTPPGEQQTMVMSYKHRGKLMNLRRMPSFTMKDIESYKPFVAKDGSFGAIYNTGKTARTRLYHHTIQNQGYYMVSVLNSVVSEPLKIDKPITDGKIVMWKGLSQMDLYRLDVTIPREGETKEQSVMRGKEAKKLLKSYLASQKKDS